MSGAGGLRGGGAHLAPSCTREELAPLPHQPPHTPPSPFPFPGGIVIVSHDARLIRPAECRLWVCDKGDCAPYNGEYDDYKSSLMEDIKAQEAGIEQVMAERALAEEAARMAAVRERARKLRELRDAAAKPAAAAPAATEVGAGGS